MHENRRGRSVLTFVAPRTLAVGLAFTAVLAQGGAAAEGDSGRVELWLSDAPLARVLEQIAGRDGVDVVVGTGVDSRIDGRLDGQRELVLATLAVEHGLDVHAEGDTVWFDSKHRPVVSLVRLAPEETDRAFAALEPALADDQIVQRTDEGLVLSGSRAFVESARRRATVLVASLAKDAPAPSVAADTIPATRDASRREVQSVWDIPGYDVDYAAEGAS